MRVFFWVPISSQEATSAAPRTRGKLERGFWPLLALLLSFTELPKSHGLECVNIFYDRGPEGYWMGKTYSVMTQNLMGHFPQFQQIVSPIELYQKGDIDKCRATIYLGSYFENKIPPAFFEDFQKTQRSVIWFGYTIWKTEIEKIFGHKFVGLTVLDKNKFDQEGLPTFFRWFDYKGETFRKFAEWSKTEPSKFITPFELVELESVKAGIADVLAWSRHSGTNRKIPYALRAGRKFYVADIPFSFVHESDRYLIAADLLFDVLEMPARTEKYALLRIEDIHPLSPLKYILDVVKLLESEKIPASFSLIPIFTDPLAVYHRLKHEVYVTMDRKPEFLRIIHEMTKNPGFDFIWHGVTHQHQNGRNPHNASSGDDFEFWDALSNKPVAEDSSQWVLDRLNDGLYTILKSGIQVPMVWLTPHYQASALDYLIFARVFPWNIGRAIYFNFKATGVPNSAGPERLWMNSSDIHEQNLRLNEFSKLSVTIDPGSPWSGQFFPYEIYGDIYGQRLLPENIGNSQPYISVHVVRTRTPKQIIEDAKRNLVLRDAWASFFFHPYLLHTYKDGGRGVFPGDTSELALLVREIRSMGYKFINASQFARANAVPLRPEPIYREVQ